MGQHKMLLRCRVMINIESNTSWEFTWNARSGTNSSGEVFALRGSLYFAKWLNLNEIHIYSDSQVMIGWINMHTSFTPPPPYGALKIEDS